MKEPRVEQPRHGDASALDEEPAEAAPPELGEHGSEIETSRGDVRREHVDVIREAFVPRGAIAPDDEHRARFTLPNDAPVVGHTTRRVENDSHGSIPGDEPGRQKGIVDVDGRRSDDDAVEERPHAVRVPYVLGARDDGRDAPWRRDTPVEALAEVRDAEVPRLRADAQRQIQVEELGRRVRNGPPRLPTAIAIRRYDDPGSVLGDFVELAAMDGERRGLRDDLPAARRASERAYERPCVLFAERRCRAVNVSIGAHGAMASRGATRTRAPHRILWEDGSGSYIGARHSVSCTVGSAVAPATTRSQAGNHSDTLTEMFPHLLISWLVLAFGLWITSALVPGFRVDGFKGALIVGAVFGVLHFFIGWLLFVAIGVGTLFLGFIFAFITRWIVSAIVLQITDALTDSLSIDNFRTALLGAAVLALLSAGQNFLFH